MSRQAQIAEFLRENPLSSSRELQLALDASQTTVSRLIRALGEAVVRVGQGPATSYAAAVDVPGNGLSVGLYNVDSQGTVNEVGELRRLSDGRYVVQSSQLHPWLAGSNGNGLYRSLPYFLEEQRPSGFLGRLVAQQLALDWGVPPDARDWNHDDLGRYLLSQADDLPGDIVVGSRMAGHVAARGPSTPISHAQYPAFADRVLSDETDPGSSAAGEQPKFLARSQESGEVIVKFSSRGGSAEAVRWQDLLRAEWLAGQVLQDNGFAVAESALIERDGRVFLESSRFDRVRETGRRGAISLEMIDAEFCGIGRGWGAVGDELARLGLLTEDDSAQLHWLETFGRWIGNTDMHLGNISMEPTTTGFALSPVYDMLPMAFSPRRGELRPAPTLSAPVRSTSNADAWGAAGLAAEDYFGRLADNGIFSPGFRELADTRAAQIRRQL